MLGALGMLGLVLAGLILPVALWDDGDDGDDDRDEGAGAGLRHDGGDVGAPPREDDDGAAAPGAGDDVARHEDGGATGDGGRTGSNGATGDDGATGGNGDIADPDTGTPPEPAPAAPGVTRTGGPGPDVVHGGAGGDDLGGGAGDDTLRGGAGDDRLFGDLGDDVLLGGEGDDRLADGHGDNTLQGGAGNDRLTTFPAGAAADGADFLDGGAGDDRLTLGPLDIARGGPGADTFLLGPGLGPAGQAGTGEIADFDPAEDSLVVVWDDIASAAPPRIALAPVAGAPGTVELFAEGVSLGRVVGGDGLTPGDVALVPASRFPD